MSRVSLEQWKMFVAVVEQGGFAQAGAALFKTQSTVGHGIRKLEQQLGSQLFDSQGRKSQLTPFGQSLVKDARQLIGHAQLLENNASSQKQACGKKLPWQSIPFTPGDTCFPSWLSVCNTSHS